MGTVPAKMLLGLPASFQYFDLFNANGQVGLVWFTYDEGGRPIWYTAGGTLDSMGTQAWPLSLIEKNGVPQLRML